MKLSVDISRALERAEDALENAEHNLAGGFLLGTVNRTYYSMFYCMTALLLSEDVQPKKHQGARAKFGELFIKTERLPRIMASYARDAFDLRQDADYDLEADVTEDEARILVENAREFCLQTRKYFEQHD